MTELKNCSDRGDSRSATLELCFHGADTLVRLPLAHLRSWMRAHRMCASFRSDVELVLAEVLNNIVEHSLPGQTNDEISIIGQIHSRCLTIDIFDHGKPYPDARLPDGKTPDPRLLPEGGFGWMLVRQLASGIHYKRQAGTNHLQLEFTPRNRA